MTNDTLTPVNQPGADLLAIADQTATLVAQIKDQTGLAEETALAVVQLAYDTVQQRFDNEMRVAEFGAYTISKEDSE